VNYPQAIGFLSSLIDYERWTYRKYEFKLDNYLKFLSKIGDPQGRLNRVVLIAGTKGKGSVAFMLTDILKAHGEKVGTYTSPHLTDYPERIRVDGRNIPKKRFAELLEGLKPAILAHEPRITFFEALTTTAFLYFLEEGTTVNVLEIGVGGRLDATNVTEPEISVITRIGYDHTKMLGKTLTRIAREKCGALRKGRSAIIAAQRPLVESLIKKAVKETAARGLWLGEDFSARLIEEKIQGIRMHYRGIKIDAEFKLPVLGTHQIENAAAAIAAAEMLIPEIKEKKIHKSLADLKLPARIEIIQDHPTVILDMSHNPESAATLRKTLDRHFASYPRRILLIGITRHKPKRRIIETLAPFFTEIWITQAKLPRAESKDRLLRLCSRFHPNCRGVNSVAGGVDKILGSLNADGLLVISGSIYVAGEALEALKARERAKVR
jgi:dihydrofolate synthase/folylpolyglutamate synthase